jgi:hypothetical protein
VSKLTAIPWLSIEWVAEELRRPLNIKMRTCNILNIHEAAYALKKALSTFQVNTII